LINEIEQSLQEDVKEGGDNYITPTWTLVFLMHNVFRNYMDSKIYHEHCQEMDKLLEERNDEKREKELYLYILKKVVHDPCPLKEEVKMGSKEDGLNNENKWGKLNFVNSPYSMELLKKFIQRCI